MFAYKGFSLLDTLVLRSREGPGAEASGVVATTAQQNPKTLYQFKFRSATITPGEKGPVVRIDGLRSGLKVPMSMGAQFNYVDVSINTDIDIREGQKVVVGKANMDGTDKAMILVVMAKVVD